MRFDPELLEARVLLGAGRVEDARRQTAARLAADPEDPDTLTLMSEIERIAGHAVDAAALAFQAVTNDPAHVDGWTALALARADAGRPDEAVAASGERMRLAPLDPDAHALHAALLDRRPVVDGAGLDAAREAVRLAPDSAGSHVALGNAHLRRGRHRDARAEYELALRIDPSNEAARHNLALVKVRTQPDRATMEFADLAAERPRDVRVILNLRVALGQAAHRAWIVVVLGAFLEFRVAGWGPRQGLSPEAMLIERYIMGGMALAMSIVVTILIWRAIRTFGERAGSLARFAVGADRALVVVLVVLVLLLAMSIGLPFIPEPLYSWAGAVYFVTALTGIVASIVRRRRLQRDLTALPVG